MPAHLAHTIRDARALPYILIADRDINERPHPALERVA
jgi:hypothetical protein